MDKIVNSRLLSFAALAVVYGLAAAVGVAAYCVLPFHFAVNLLVADVAATLLVFGFGVLFKNASVYDPYWSVQPPVIATAFALEYGVNDFGVCLLLALWFWGIRLTANWAYTFQGLAHEDWRYTLLREKTGRWYPLVNLSGIHLVPTLVVYGCLLPVVVAIAQGLQNNHISTFLCVLAIFAATMQGVADRQLHTFRKHKTGTFIREGLWKYSRHPNYLAEILIWWCIALAVVAASQNWWLLAGAVANTLLFWFISIPLAEGRQSQKEGWQQYKEQTRVLWPFYKKG